MLEPHLAQKERCTPWWVKDFVGPSTRMELCGTRAKTPGGVLKGRARGGRGRTEGGSGVRFCVLVMVPVGAGGFVRVRGYGVCDSAAEAGAFQLIGGHDWRLLE